VCVCVCVCVCAGGVVFVCANDVGLMATDETGPLDDGPDEVRAFFTRLKRLELRFSVQRFQFSFGRRHCLDWYYSAVLSGAPLCA